MATNFGPFQPVSGAITGQPQAWVNTQTGQQVFGTPDGFAALTLTDQSGQPTGQHMRFDGSVSANETTGQFLKSSLPKLGAVVAGGATLAALTPGAAATGAVTADLPVTGVAETVDPTTGLVTSSLPSAATSAAASGGGFAWKQFLPSAISSGVQTIVGSLAARSAANQQKQAGQAAAQSFSPFAQGGLDAYNQMLAKYGIRPVSAPPGSIAQRPGMPPGAPMSPSPISQPIPTIAPPGAPMAAQPSPYTLASFGVDPTATPTASSFGGR